MIANIEDKIKFLMPDGSLMNFKDYQAQFSLKGKQIAKNFYYNEPRFRQDIEDNDELIVCHLLMKVIDRYRDLKMMPVNLNSFNRSEEKQKALKEKGYKAATNSPHVVKLAGDADTATEADTIASVKMIKQAAKELGINIRIGYKEYLADGNTFIHIDVCPEYFASGKPWHSRPHPLSWEQSIEW